MFFQEHYKIDYLEYIIALLICILCIKNVSPQFNKSCREMQPLNKKKKTFLTILMSEISKEKNPLTNIINKYLLRLRV